MWYKVIKQSFLIDAAILTSLVYITALLLEQFKPGFFSNNMDISLVLFLALILIVLVLLVRPAYHSNLWVKIYYLIWSLALALLFVKLVTRWLEVDLWQAGLIVIGILALVIWVSSHYQDKPSTSNSKP